jgi:Arc/MetJ family transcription regulator
METLIDDEKIKNLFKQALIEAIEEKKDAVHDLLVEAMEDVSMIHAIQEGEKSGAARRDEVLRALKGKA